MLLLLDYVVNRLRALTPGAARLVPLGAPLRLGLARSAGRRSPNVRRRPLACRSRRKATWRGYLPVEMAAEMAAIWAGVSARSAGVPIRPTSVSMARWMAAADGAFFQWSWHAAQYCL